MGRNGGLRFLALFEKGSEEKLASFTQAVSERIARVNAESQGPKILYTWGRAFHEPDINGIGQLLTLANDRVHEHTVG